MSCFPALSWQEQVTFPRDDDNVFFTLHQHAELDFYSASLSKQQCTDRHVDSLKHIILIPEPTVFVLNQHISIL
jgi:hypothetical protein